MIEAGLLPGALIRNINTKFISKTISLDVVTEKSIFTQNLKKNQIISMPIAHGEGNYQADDDTLKQLHDDDCIAFKYSNQIENHNLNGSIDSIAGILNKQKNVLGMMPPPERACEEILGSDDGVNIFKSMIN